ncbi:MAG: AAA family ATPase [Acidimicrobiia bacterium]|nr:AAA family ATPase [Acidimicrobiia bacterium]
MSTRAILVTGGGGVGKTTISAALAVRGAQLGLRTLVVTVDPAKRLADALGVDSLGSEPTPNERLDGLWAAMLDAASSWNAIIHRHAPPDVAERLEHNEFWEAVAGRFPASQAYAAAEEMANFLDSRVWDLIVVDTPPSAGGIGFFTAPGDMRDLVGGRLLKWLTGARLPGRKSFFSVAGRPALRIAGNVLGTDLLERVAEFLFDLRTTYDGLAKRAKEIERHFRQSTILVVTTADPAPLREAGRFFRELPETATTPAAVLFNRMLPVEWQDKAAELEADGGTRERALERNLFRWAAEAHRQSDARKAFVDRYHAPVAALAWQPDAPIDIDALAHLIRSASNIDFDQILQQ